MKNALLLIAAGLLLLGSGISQARATVFSDEDFDDDEFEGNWDTYVVPRGLANDGGTYDGDAMQSSINPNDPDLPEGNPPPYRQVFAARAPDTATVLDNSTGIWSFYRTTYDPAVMGGIIDIDFAIDTKQLIPTCCSGGSLAPAVRQDDTNYVARFVGRPIPETFWNRQEFLGLTQNDFRDPDNISSMPDFSATGSEIQVGWVYVVSTPTTQPVSRTVGFDNWTMAINTSLEVSIDIKPGDDPNSINLCNQGNVTVAILTTPDFDATTVDPDTARLADAEVRTVGKSAKDMAHIEDVDGDGDLDLVLQFATVDLALGIGTTDTEATLNATTFDGQDVTGTDSIRIVKDC